MIYYKNSNELYHHGVTGQKWGKRNGPPYPLDDNAKVQASKKRRFLRFRKKEEPQETQEELRARLLERPNPQEVSDNMDLFSTPELYQMYNRMTVESNITRLLKQQDTKDSTYRTIMKGLDQANKDIDTMDKTVTRLVGGQRNRAALEQKAGLYVRSRIEDYQKEQDPYAEERRIVKEIYGL